MKATPVPIDIWADRRSDDVRTPPAGTLFAATSTCSRPPARSQADENPMAQPAINSTPRATRGRFLRLGGRGALRSRALTSGPSDAAPLVVLGGFSGDGA